MTTTTALGRIATASDATGFAIALAGINGFVRATAGELPDPSSLSVHPQRYERQPPRAHMLFDSLDDLRNWAAYLQVPVVPRDCRPRHDQIHHYADAMWGPVAGKMVAFHMVYIEEVEPHVCSDDCDPGNCEVQHEAEFSLPRDCEAGEWS